jgi:hypothetical protein
VSPVRYVDNLLGANDATRKRFMPPVCYTKNIPGAANDATRGTACTVIRPVPLVTNDASTSDDHGCHGHSWAFDQIFLPGFAE